MDDDLFLNENTDEIIQRYEQFLQGENAGYFDVDELETIAEYFLRKGRTKDSNHALDVGMRLHPLSSELLLKRAKTYLASGDVQKALHILDGQSSGDEYEMQMLKVEAYTRLGRLAEADLLIKHVLEQGEFPLDAICLDVAFVFLSQGKYVAALDYVKMGHEHNAQNLDVLFEMAHCYEQLESANEAVETYKKILDVNSFISEAWFNLGQIYFVQKNYTQSLEAYEFCIAIDDKDALAWLQKAHVHFYLNNFKESIDACLVYNEIEGENWEVDFFIAESYERLQNYTEAIGYYQKVIALMPTNADAYVGAGICMLELDMHQDSLIYFENAIRCAPDEYDAYVYIAEAYNNLGRDHDARVAYEKSLHVEPKQPATWVALANLLMDMGEYEEALKAYTEAYKQDEDLEYINLLMAVACAKNEQYEAMFFFLDKSSEKDPKEVELFFEICPEIGELISKVIEKNKQKE